MLLKMSYFVKFPAYLCDNHWSL